MKIYRLTFYSYEQHESSNSYEEFYSTKEKAFEAGNKGKTEFINDRKYADELRITVTELELDSNTVLDMWTIYQAYSDHIIEYFERMHERDQHRESNRIPWLEDKLATMKKHRMH